MASENNSVICDEVFEEGCQPSNEEILEYAVRIGISPDKEPQLLHLARDGLMQALPADWKVCFHKTQGIYYHNLQTKESQWEHPLDEEYKRLVEQTRNRTVQTSVVDPDDTSLLDSGIRSLASTNTNNSMDASLRSGGGGLAGRTLMPLERRVIKLQPLDGLQQPQQQQRNVLSSENTSAFGPLLTKQQQIDLKIPGTGDASNAVAVNGPAAAAPVKGLQIFGAGSMFLKSNTNARKPIEAPAEDRTENSSSAASNNWAAASVKGILRDSSLSDVKNKSGETHRLSESENGSEDRKSVRFNLVRRSGDLQATVVKSSDESSNDDDADDDEEDGGDDFDDDAAAVAPNNAAEEVDFVKNDRKPPIAGNLQPKPTATKPVAPKLSLRTQFSLDDYRKPPSTALRMLGRTFSTDSASDQHRSSTSSTSLFDRKAEKSTMHTPVKPLYEDNTTDSESVSGKPSVGAGDQLGETAARETMRRQMNERLEQFRLNLQQEQLQQEDAMRRQMQRELSELNATLHKTPPPHDNAALATTRAELDQQLADALQQMRTEHAAQMRTTLAAEQRTLQQQYDAERQQFEHQHQQRMQRLADEFQANTDEYQAELETRQNLEISNHEQKLKLDFDRKQSEISAQHRAAVDTLQRNHTEIFNDLERDLKSEAELLRKEHSNNLAQVKVKLQHELEVEKQRMRDTGELQQFEKLRCEKRLLEDKYRCLKEKYVRLKTDVKVRLERQGHSRRSQHPQSGGQQLAAQAPGSETDRSFSLCHRGGDDEHQRSMHGTQSSSGGTMATATPPSNVAADHGKPPTAPATPLLSSRGRSRDKSRERRISSSGGSAGGGGGAAAPLVSAHSNSKDHHATSKPFGAAVKYLSHLHQHQQQLPPDDTTSFSQSDTTVSNNFSHVKYLPAAAALGDNGNSDTEAFRRNQENNNHGARDTTRKKQFTRLKSASTSRLNATPAAVATDMHNAASGSGGGAAAMRPCTPMESLRLQLQKLEDLEDQFPENALLLDTTHPYHLRYPFKDAHLVVATSGDAQTTAVQTTTAQGSSSELEFFKHRIHMERDALRRAKEALRTQRTNFRMRQREIKHGQGMAAAGGGGGASGRPQQLDMQIEEAKELTDMEVGLHRTRALLGEKVIRLRHLEQSLQRLYEKEKPAVVAVQPQAATEAVGMGAHKKHQQQQQQHHRLPLPLQRDDAATVSDLSSHSSSGFSSTEYATDTLHTKRGEASAVRPDAMDIVQSLEHLNAEIREIWEILSRQRTTQGLPPPPTMSMDWPGATGGGPASYAPTQSHFQAGSGGPQQPAAAVPTFFDRLETYRQFAANRGPIGTAGGPAGSLLSTLAANTIVSQAPMHHGGGGGGAVGGGISSGGQGYTTSLVERTQDLRNWLRQAKNEHELLSAGPQTDL